MRWKPGLTLLIILALGPGLAAAEDADRQRDRPRPLAETREIDRAYGLSLQPPQDTRIIRQTASPYLMEIRDEREQFNMFLSVKRFRKHLNLKEVSHIARTQMAQLRSTASVTHEGRLVAEDHPAVVLHYQLEGARSDQPLFMGQAWVQIAADTFVLLEIEAPIAHEHIARPTLDAVLETLEVSDRQQLEAERAAAIAQMRELQRRLAGEKLREAIGPEQLFRIVDVSNSRRPRDIGWVRYAQEAAERLDQPGVVMDAQSRIFDDGHAYDTRGRYFVAEDRSYEEWSITTTQREPARRLAARSTRRGTTPPAMRTWIETGIGTSTRLEIKLEEVPGSTRTLSFPRPDQVYLSQLEVLMLPQLLPPDRPATYGFYTYHSQLTRMVYRSEQIVPTLDGFTVITSPAPNEPELKATYDGQGRLREKQLSATRRLIPTTHAELRTLWPDG